MLAERQSLQNDYDSLIERSGRILGRRAWKKDAESYRNRNQDFTDRWNASERAIAQQQAGINYLSNNPRHNDSMREIENENKALYPSNFNYVAPQGGFHHH
jgi:GTP-sensing pleiotropic transcriptional regulator CodY